MQEQLNNCLYLRKMISLSERDTSLMFLFYIEGRTEGVKSIGNLSKQGLICLISKELAGREITGEKRGRERPAEQEHIDVYV